MDKESQIIQWLRSDTNRLEILNNAARLKLKDWCLAAGFVRNLIWDRLHGYKQATRLNDIDLTRCALIIKK